MGNSMDTRSSETAFMAVTVALGNTESSEEEAVSGETGEVCTAQMHKMAIAITGSMESKTSTSETDGAAVIELESGATGGLEKRWISTWHQLGDVVVQPGPKTVHKPGVIQRSEMAVS